jgi:hypothetical protein
MAKIARTLYIEESIWKESRAIIKETMNMHISLFIEIQLRTLIKSQKGSFQQVIEEAMKGVILGDKTLTEEEKKKMNGLFESDKKVKGQQGAALPPYQGRIRKEKSRPLKKKKKE